MEYNIKKFDKEVEIEVLLYKRKEIKYSTYLYLDKSEAINFRDKLTEIIKKL